MNTSAHAASWPRWIQVGYLLDGTASIPLRDAHLVYDDSTIRYVGIESPPAALLRQEQAEPDERLPDSTLLPGLIESHAHLFLEGGELDLEARKAYLARSPGELLKNALSRLEPILRCGIMAYRDAGDRDGVGLALSRLYGQSDRPSMPYVDSPGAAIHHRGRYGSFMADPIEDHLSLDEAVAARVAQGAHRIKLIPTGIIDFKKGCVTKAPQMDAEEVAAIVAAASRFGRQTFAHASGADGIQNAIAGGVDSIEHGFFVRDDQLARMRDRNIAWVPTFAPVQLQIDEAERMGWSEAIVSNLRRIVESHARSLVRARVLGVTIIAGSDAGTYGVAHAWGFLYELELMQRAGLSGVEVINAATGNAARRLGFAEPIGRIAPGCRSRFILTRHAPLDTVANLRKEKRIIFDGRELPCLTEKQTQGL